MRHKYLYCLLFLLFLSGCATSGPRLEAIQKKDKPSLTVTMKKNSKEIFAIADGEAIILSHTPQLKNPALGSYLESLNPKTRLYGKKVKAVVTAYYGPLRFQKYYVTGSYEEETKLNGRGKRTSSGTEPKIGTVAADTAVFPYGTKIMVEGYGLCIVEDTGSSIKGNRLDLFMGYGEPALLKALRWGEKEVEILVLK